MPIDDPLESSPRLLNYQTKWSTFIIKVVGAATQRQRKKGRGKHNISRANKRTKSNRKTQVWKIAGQARQTGVLGETSPGGKKLSRVRRHKRGQAR